MDRFGWLDFARSALLGPGEGLKRRRTDGSCPVESPSRCVSLRYCTHGECAPAVWRNADPFGNTPSCQVVQKICAGWETTQRGTSWPLAVLETEEQLRKRRPLTSLEGSLPNSRSAACSSLLVRRSRVTDALSARAPASPASWHQLRMSRALERSVLSRSRRPNRQALEALSCCVFGALAAQTLRAGSKFRSVSPFNGRSKDHTDLAGACRAVLRHGRDPRSTRLAVQESPLSRAHSLFRSFFSSVSALKDAEESARVDSHPSAPECGTTSFQSGSGETTTTHRGNVPGARSRQPRERIPVLPAASASQDFDGLCLKPVLNESCVWRNHTGATEVLQGLATISRDASSLLSGSHRLHRVQQGTSLLSTPRELQEPPVPGRLDRSPRNEERSTSFVNYPRSQWKRQEPETVQEGDPSSTTGYYEKYRREDHCLEVRPHVRIKDQTEKGNFVLARSQHGANASRQRPSDSALPWRPESWLDCNSDVGSRPHVCTEDFSLSKKGVLLRTARDSPYDFRERAQDQDGLGEGPPLASVRQRPSLVTLRQASGASDPAAFFPEGRSESSGDGATVKHAFPIGWEDRSTQGVENSGTRETSKGVLRHLLEQAVSLLETFEASRIDDTEKPMRGIEAIQAEIFRVHEQMAGHLASASSAELADIRGHVEALLLRQKLLEHRLLLLRLVEELYTRDMIPSVRTSMLVRYFRDLCDTNQASVPVPPALVKRVYSSILERKEELLGNQGLANSLVLFLYNCSLLRLPTGDLFSIWAKGLLKHSATAATSNRLRVSPPLVVFLSRILVAERCGVPLDPRTSPFFAAVSHSVDLAAGDGRPNPRQPPQSRNCIQKNECATPTSCSEETRWVSNAMRSISGAASVGIPAHTAVDIVFERVVQLAQDGQSESHKLLFFSRAERHSSRLLHYVWSLCFYGLHLHENFPVVLNACCKHGRLEHAIQYHLNFRLPAFIPFQVAEAVMLGHRGDGELVKRFLSPLCVELFTDVLTCVRPSCPAWASNSLSPHPAFLSEFTACVELKGATCSFINRRGVSFLHLTALDGDSSIVARREGIVLVDTARQPRGLNREPLGSLMGGHMMHNRLLKKLGWNLQVVCQAEWNRMEVYDKEAFVDKLLRRAKAGSDSSTVADSVSAPPSMPIPTTAT